MNKKKMMIGTASMMIVAMMFMPIYAESESTGEMNLTYTEGNQWTVTIPSNVDLSTNKEINQQITATEINIEPNKKLEVSVSTGVSNGQAVLTRKNGITGSDDVTTTVSLSTGGAGIADKEVVAEFSGTKKNTSISADKNGTLYFSKLSAKDGGTVKAGEYTGKITFLLEVK